MRRSAASPTGAQAPAARSAAARSAVKQAACSVVEERLGALVDLSHRIHGEPELSFEEHRAAEWTADLLEAGGFQVERGICGIPTAFSAELGTGPATVALCAEYDALPDVGHACGHNIIAASAVGAGLALAPVAADLGLRVKVIGTPAEELGGGKAYLLDGGAFDGVDAAMMVHPWPTDRLQADCLAVSQFDVELLGKAAHASAAPWEGVNAADAMTIAQVAIGLLRQQLHPGDQVHGVVTNGGAAANVIPSRVEARYMSRAATIHQLEVLAPRVRACFEAGAHASGATLRITEIGKAYTHMEPDGVLLDAYRANAEALGRRFDLDDQGVPRPTFSTDMANVSLAVPTIHPLIGIDAGGAVNHQPAFAAACVTASADQALRDGAVALAWTAIDAVSDEGLRRHLGLAEQAP